MEVNGLKLGTVERTMEFDFKDIARVATLDIRIVDASAWFQSAESREPGWQATDALFPGRLIVARIRLGPVT